MHWSLYVLIGACLNAIVNLGYKIQGAKDSFVLVAATVMAVSSVTLLFYASATKNLKWDSIFSGWNPFIIIGMGVGSACVLFFLITALSKGPISLVDPLWACVYAVSSIIIGILFFREMPNITGFVGVAFYLIGAFLMTRG